MLNLSNYYENVNQNHNEISHHRIIISKTILQITNVDKNVEKRELLHFVGGNISYYGKE